MFQGKGAACAKPLRQEGAWGNFGMEIQVARMEHDRKQSWQWGRQGLTKVKGSEQDVKLGVPKNFE